MSDNSLLFLSRDNIHDLIDMPITIGLMRDAFGQISSGSIDAPLRTNIDIPAHQAAALFMPAHSGSSGVISLKLVTVFPENKSKDLPLIHAMIMLLDGTNGKPLAVMDGEVITAMRTGAASGLATQILANPEARILGVFGAGTQARTQIQAVRAVRDITEVIVFDPNNKAAEQLCREVSGSARPAKNISDVCSCDIICTATTSPSPVLEDNLIKTGVHINAVGAYKPHERELPGQLIARARVVVDSRESCLAEAGDIVVPIRENLITAAHIQAELGEIVLGQKPGRENSNQITVFKSVGHAAQDLVVAGHVYREAIASGIGTLVNM